VVNQNRKKYKYDVAFSFLGKDEELAMQIEELLRHRVKTFIYSRKQSDLVGKDGEKILNQVFGSQSRIVVVLFRKGWGNTPFTRIEETAMKNRAYTEGYDFTLFIPLERPAAIPDWIPKPRIWMDIDRWGIQSAASIIELRIQDAGGQAKEETIEERLASSARKIVFEEEKKKFFRSEVAVKTANELVDKLYSRLEQVITSLNEKEKDVKLKIVSEARQRAIYSHRFSLIFSWYVAYANTLDGSKFILELWQGIFCIGRRRSLSIEKPIKIYEIEFNIDQTITGDFVWKELHGRVQSLSNEELISYSLKLLLDEIHENQLHTEDSEG
jgi:hypothetical protein